MQAKTEKTKQVRHHLELNQAKTSIGVCLGRLLVKASFPQIFALAAKHLQTNIGLLW